MKRFTIEGYQYEVSQDKLNYDDWFVQENSGDGTPILRRMVTPGFYKANVDALYASIHGYALNHGYYPFDNLILANDMTDKKNWLKVKRSNNPMLANHGINPLND